MLYANVSSVLVFINDKAEMLMFTGFSRIHGTEGEVFMYPEVIKKMAFSKEHKDLLLKLYNKEITRREYDRLVQALYRPAKESI